ncbi:hypothetical protein CEV34_1458 [Brucella pseudogrignonensis]|uniref:Uncharacterized protein n=1 Tax=Brucella pseudogrignonensis TaxID=419475 RepID=A0A256GKY0_9HYPH|nr:hypothetical protein CEV34_1458 [Brucella pseudogrignonensis]
MFRSPKGCERASAGVLISRSARTAQRNIKKSLCVYIN